MLRVLLIVAGTAMLLAAQDHWVATWGTAELLARGPAPAPNPNAAPPKQEAPTINARGFDNQTVRMIARTSMAGKRVRVKLENAFGSAPVKVGAAHIALREKDSAIVIATDRALTFNGEPGVTIGPGAAIASDPVDLTLPALSDVALGARRARGEDPESLQHQVPMDYLPTARIGRLDALDRGPGQLHWRHGRTLEISEK